MRKLSKFVWLFGVLSGLFVLSCESQIDYYTLLRQEGCEPQTNELTDSCREAILRKSKIDNSSFVGHKQALDALVQGIYELMNIQLAFPKDKKIFGLATFEEAQMYDFKDTFLQDEHANFNRLMLNYVLNSISSFKYGCLNDPRTLAFYQSEVIYICDLFATVARSNVAALLHEARHHAAVHSVECNDGLKCDKGMDGAQGWWIGLAWGILQGNGQDPHPKKTALSIDDMSTIAIEMTEILNRIFALPKLLQPAKDPKFEDQYAKFFPEIEQLQYPLAVQQVRFEPVSLSIPKDLHPSAMTIGDFNLDGKPDLALASTEQVDILLNQGDFKFAQASSTSLKKCSSIHTIASADFDGDNRLDLMIACDSIQILWGQGTGQFTVSDYPQLSLGSLSEIRIADVNQDQRSDLVFSNFNQLTLTIALSTSGRSFTTSTYQPTGTRGQWAYSLFLTDMNQDHIPDLMTNWSASNIAVSLNQANGTFASNPLWTKTDEPNISVLKVVDWNQDHKPDVLIESDFQDHRVLLLGRGDGTFMPEMRVEIPINMHNQQVEVADFNQDGYTDLMAFPTSGGMAWTLSYGTAWNGFQRTFPVSVEYAPEWGHDFVVADLNQDGWQDIALLTPREKIIFYVGVPISFSFEKNQ